MNNARPDLTEFIERLQSCPDNETWRLELNEIGNELLALAAGDDAMWGLLSIRQAGDFDSDIVQAVGRIVFSSATRPMTYREILQHRAVLDLPSAYYRKPFTRKIVPWAHAEAARIEYLKEVRAMALKLQKEAA